MSYAHENRKLRRTLIPKKPGLDRRVKLTDRERLAIKRMRHAAGWSYQKLADKFGVSKRLVFFICNPAKLEKAMKGRRERGQEGRYKDHYSGKKWARTMRRHRAHKDRLYKSGRLIVETKV